MAGNNSGFIQLRRGLSEHVRDGRLSFFEASLYVFILMDTNPATGLCHGSAGLFAAVYNISSRSCRDALEDLEKKGYLRRFPTRGKHGSYPILVNKFMCSSGAMKGMYVNTEKTTTYSNVFYEKSDDGVDDSVNDGGNERVNDSAASKILDTREEKQDKQQELKLSSPTATTQPKVKVRLQDFPEMWNRLCGNLPKVETFSDSRKKQVTTRIRQGITVARFEQAVLCCIEKPFLRGQNDKNWNATFDWLIKNDRNIEKAINEYSFNGGNHAAISNGTGNTIMGVVQNSISGGQHQDSSWENGHFSAGVEVGRSDAGTIHASLDQPRPESVPSGNEEYLDF